LQATKTQVDLANIFQQRYFLATADGTAGEQVTLIFKICDEEEWRAAERVGAYDGSPVDRRDGFIHFSTAEQLAETAARHFARRDDLVLIGVWGTGLGAALRYEPSRGGALFPHLYGTLQLKNVCLVAPMQLGEDGVHRLPLNRLRTLP